MAETTTAPLWPFHTEPDFIEVDGLRTAYRRDGAGEPVLFLHGAGQTRRWLPFHRALAERVELLAPEHPGFGDTPLTPDVDRIDDVVLHYDALVRAFGWERFHLVGHSLGGFLAAELAVFYPDRIKSLTLVTAPGLRVPGHPMADVFRMTPEEADGLLFNGHASEYAEYLEEGDPGEALIHGYQEMTMLARLHFNPRYDVKLDHRLARVTAPALLVAAEEDRLIPRAHMERWAELLPNGRLELLRGERHPTGHLPHVTEPQKLATTIADFVAAQAGA